VTARCQRPVAAEARHDDRQGAESGQPTARRVHVAAARVRLLLGVDDATAAAERDARARAAREEVDGGGERVWRVAARAGRVGADVEHLLAVDAVRRPTEQPLARPVGHVRRRPNQRRRARRRRHHRQRRLRRDRVDEPSDFLLVYSTVIVGLSGSVVEFEGSRRRTSRSWTRSRGHFGDAVRGHAVSWLAARNINPRDRSAVAYQVRFQARCVDSGKSSGPRRDRVRSGGGDGVELRVAVVEARVDDVVGRGPRELDVLLGGRQAVSTAAAAAGRHGRSDVGEGLRHDDQRAADHDVVDARSTTGSACEVSRVIKNITTFNRAKTVQTIGVF